MGNVARLGEKLTKESLWDVVWDVADENVDISLTFFP